MVAGFTSEAMDAGGCDEASSIADPDEITSLFGLAVDDSTLDFVEFVVEVGASLN